MRPLFLVLSLSLLVACSSEEPAPEPAPTAEATPAAASEPPKAKPKARRTRRRRTKKRTRKRRTRTTVKAVKEGHVYVSFSKADLKTQVLPAIEEQVGVEIRWLGTPRRVNLPLKRELPFADAMDLICRFSDTHLIRTKGRYELRDGYQGRLDSDGIVLDSSGSGSSSSRRSSGGSARPRSRGGSSSSRGGASTSKEGWRETHDSAVQRRSGNEAKDILQGMGTRHSGSPR